MTLKGGKFERVLHVLVPSVWWALARGACVAVTIGIDSCRRFIAPEKSWSTTRHHSAACVSYFFLIFYCYVLFHFASSWLQLPLGLCRRWSQRRRTSSSKNRHFLLDVRRIQAALRCVNNQLYEEERMERSVWRLQIPEKLLGRQVGGLLPFTEKKDGNN